MGALGAKYEAIHKLFFVLATLTCIIGDASCIKIPYVGNGAFGIVGALLVEFQLGFFGNRHKVTNRTRGGGGWFPFSPALFKPTGGNHLQYNKTSSIKQQ
jgi:hypothetical protein